MPLSAKQMEYLALAWQCFDSEPKIDYNKFASVAGLKTAASARELMRVTKNKLREEYGALSTNLQSANSNANGTPTPKTPTKKGTPRAATATPASRKRARKTLEAVVENGGSGSGSDDEEEEVSAAKKAKAATPATNGGTKRGEVKSEPGHEAQAGGEEEEVNFF